MSELNIRIGLLILRIGIGSMFVLHGWPKLLGGPHGWYRLGQNMQYLGINFLPLFWGFMAMASEFLGGILLIIGIAVRPVAALMLFTMLVAAVGNLAKGYGLEGIMEIIEVSSGLAMLVLVTKPSRPRKGEPLNNAGANGPVVDFKKPTESFNQ